MKPEWQPLPFDFYSRTVRDINGEFVGSDYTGPVYPVFGEGISWFFIDSEFNENDCCGPFQSEEIALRALKAYKWTYALDPSELEEE